MGPLRLSKGDVKVTFPDIGQGQIVLSLKRSCKGDPKPLLLLFLNYLYLGLRVRLSQSATRSLCLSNIARRWGGFKYRISYSY